MAARVFKENVYCDRDTPFLRVEVVDPDKEKFFFYEGGSTDSPLYPHDSNKHLVLLAASKKEDHQYKEASPPKTQPTLSIYLTEAGATPFEITLEQPKAQQGRQIALLHYEILSLKGAPGIGYVFERIINIQ